MANWEYTETELFRYGEEYSIYHVFASCAVGRTVLVFAEARKGDGADADCPHDIVMKKSTDGGKCFSEERILLSSESGPCYANAIPLYDTVIGRLFLFFSDNQKNVKTENYYCFSDDLGESWSDPVCITACLERVSDPLPFHLAGPGHGICLQNGPFAGRLLMPFWHRSERRTAPVAERGYCVSALYSDDHGKTWQTTEYLGQEFLCNESRIVETKKSLLWIMRTRSSRQCEARSDDGGSTWHAFALSDLPEARCCDVGAISLSAKDGYEDMVLLSHVSHPRLRSDMEICFSLDGGSCFSGRFSLMQGDAMPGYSDLCVIREEEPIIGLVHCRNNHVLFSRISLQALTGGKYDGTTRTVWLQ